MNALSQGIVIAAFLAFCRIGACFMLMPGISSARVPIQVRLFVSVAATGGLLAFLWDRIYPYVDPRPQILAPMIVSELLVGGLIGAMTRLYMEALRFLNESVGQIVDNWTTWTVDLSTSRPYSIPYENFDEKKGWFFNSDAALEAVVPQKLKIKSE